MKISHMKLAATLAVAALQLIAVCAQERTENQAKAKESEMKFVAHRGYSAKFPENTIPAFEAAIERAAKDSRITGIEIDIRLTKDNAMAVFHDDKIDVKGVKTPVEQIEYADLLKLTENRFKGAKVPVLDEVFACVDHRLELLVEIKDGGFDKTALMDALDASLKSYDPKGDVILHSFSPVFMRMAVERFEGRGVRFGVLVGKAEELSKFSPELLAKMDSIHPQWKSLLDQEERYAAYGKPFNVWTVNGEKELQLMKNMKNAAMIRAIMTDDLSLLERR